MNNTLFIKCHQTKFWYITSMCTMSWLHYYEPEAATALLNSRSRFHTHRRTVRIVLCDGKQVRYSNNWLDWLTASYYRSIGRRGAGGQLPSRFWQIYKAKPSFSKDLIFLYYYLLPQIFRPSNGSYRGGPQVGQMSKTRQKIWESHCLYLVSMP